MIRRLLNIADWIMLALAVGLVLFAIGATFTEAWRNLTPTWV